MVDDVLSLLVIGSNGAGVSLPSSGAISCSFIEGLDISSSIISDYFACMF